MTGNAIDTSKLFTERLRDRVRGSSRGDSGRKRATFLAARPDIEAALMDKWPVSDIWAQLVDEGRIDCSYQWFAKFVREYCRNAPAPSSAPDPAQKTPAVPPSDPPPRPKPARFNHPSTPKKEDLI